MFWYFSIFCDISWYFFVKHVSSMFFKIFQYLSIFSIFCLVSNIFLNYILIFKIFSRFSNVFQIFLYIFFVFKIFKYFSCVSFWIITKIYIACTRKREHPGRSFSVSGCDGACWPVVDRNEFTLRWCVGWVSCGPSLG